MRRSIWHILVQALILAWAVTACAADPAFLDGVDISMLPSIEKAGGVFREGGKPADAIQILRDHGCNLYRLRLFVQPSSDFNGTYGAVQNLDYIRALAKRIKAAGGEFLLDLHYSDTWADPGKQFEPEAWKKLSFDQLVQKVHDYTSAVLADFAADGDEPDMVQVGNEITGGMIWPRGKVNVPPDRQAAQWQRFAQLFDAGATAVREASTPDHKIRVMIHIHGGGNTGLPQWFFGKFNQNKVDFDIIGLSFYPAWGGSIDSLKRNMAELVKTYDKDIFIAETSYPWRDIQTDQGNDTMQWPQTPAGQKQFLADLIAALHGVPGGHGLGFAWWYPEAIRTPGLFIWRNGGEALFDESGQPLPALDLFSQ
jgi:arabinogalactan endo-1,4-beta-galactosidase